MHMHLCPKTDTCEPERTSTTSHLTTLSAPHALIASRHGRYSMPYITAASRNLVGMQRTPRQVTTMSHLHTHAVVFSCACSDAPLPSLSTLHSPLAPLPSLSTLHSPLAPLPSLSTLHSPLAIVSSTVNLSSSPHCCECSRPTPLSSLGTLCQVCLPHNALHPLPTLRLSAPTGTSASQLLLEHVLPPAASPPLSPPLLPPTTTASTTTPATTSQRATTSGAVNIAVLLTHKHSPTHSDHPNPTRTDTRNSLNTHVRSWW
jgi:hypothetical protein